jgi:hydrogenase nickel incorporation protein HypA/HybF
VHELSIALSLIDVVQEESARRGGAVVTSVRLRLGPLSGVVKDALLSAYKLAREETPLARCELMIQEMPIRLYCCKCAAEQDAESMQMLCCVVCGEPSNDIRGGRELEISALEIES